LYLKEKDQVRDLENKRVLHFPLKFRHIIQRLKVVLKYIHKLPVLKIKLLHGCPSSKNPKD
jgi:hypothetical protein